jgi:hypothetical protein
MRVPSLEAGFATGYVVSAIAPVAKKAKSKKN